MIVALVDDLIFFTKIVQTARTLGKEAKQTKNVESFKEAVLMLKPELVFLDLSLKSDDPFEAVNFLKAHLGSSYGEGGLRIVGYYSHVEGYLAERARQEGIGEYYVRSALVRKLPEVISGQEVPAGAIESDK